MEFIPEAKTQRKERALKYLMNAFRECKTEGFRFSAFGDALIITNIGDQKQSIVGADNKVINLGRKAMRVCFDEDGVIK